MELENSILNNEKNTYENDSLNLMVWSQQSKRESNTIRDDGKAKSKVKVTRNKHLLGHCCGFHQISFQIRELGQETRAKDKAK